MGERAITDGLIADTTPVDKSLGHFDGESVAFPTVSTPTGLKYSHVPPGPLAIYLCPTSEGMIVFS